MEQRLWNNPSLIYKSKKYIEITFIYAQHECKKKTGCTNICRRCNRDMVGFLVKHGCNGCITNLIELVFSYNDISGLSIKRRKTN
jgi:hypothetical protein